MSIEALTWAMNLAPVPKDKSKPSAACAAVLVGLANHADPDGRAAFPSIDTLIRYTRLSRRTVITALDRLQQEGIISPCDPDVVAAKIKRADRRPNGYDLAMERYRDDLSQADLAAIARSNPMLRHAVESMMTSGVQRLHVVGEEPGATCDERGATDESRGATDAERGATAAPEPSKNPPTEPSREPSGDGVAAAPPSKRGTRLPEDWEPDEDMKDWFRQQPFAQSINPVMETAKFKDYWKAAPGQRGVKIDWPATWRNWMRSAADRRGGQPHRPAASDEYRAAIANDF